MVYASAYSTSSWGPSPRCTVDLRSPYTHDPWVWRSVPPTHAAITRSPRALRRNDPGDALRVIADKYGDPVSYCVLGGNIASVSNWVGITFAEQYDAVTRRAGAFPCGGMYYLALRGPDAARVLDLLTPRNIEQLDVGQATFAIFTTPEGTVDTEGVVLRDGEQSFLVSIGGDTRPPTWLHDAIDAYPDVVAEEAHLSSFNIKGPLRETAMARLLADEFAGRVARLARFRALRARTRWGADAWILRTVIGIEMWAEPEVIHLAWREMVADADWFTPCGWDVLHTFRLECSDFVFYLCPLDIHRGTYLFDVGLQHTISRHKRTPFVGAEALQDRDRFGGRLRFAGLMALSPDAPRRQVGEQVLVDGPEELAGYVTSAGYSPKAGRELCFAHLSPYVTTETVTFADGTRWRVLPVPMPADPDGTWAL